MSLKTQFFHKSVAGKSFVLLSDEQFWPLNVVKLIWWGVKKVGSFMVMEQAIAKAPYLHSSRQKKTLTNKLNCCHLRVANGQMSRVGSTTVNFCFQF